MIENTLLVMELMKSIFKYFASLPNPVTELHMIQQCIVS